MPILKSCCLMCVLASLLWACSDTGRMDLPIAPVGVLENPKKIAQGRQLFLYHCAECHGSLSEGRTQRAARFNPGAPDFHERRYQSALPGYLYLRIERGRNMKPFNAAGSVMPAWKAHLSREQIWTLVAYIRDQAHTSSLQ